VPLEKNRSSPEDIALRLLSFRDHSREELRQKLRARKIPLQEVEETLCRLEGHGFLDDLRYARRLAAHLSKDELLGPQRIRQKLIQKGIHADCIREVMEESEKELSTRDRVQKLLQIKLKNRTPAELSTQEKSQWSRFLYYRGFSWGDIHEAFQSTGGLAEE
jgi:regulatory protein